MIGFVMRFRSMCLPFIQAPPFHVYFLLAFQCQRLFFLKFKKNLKNSLEIFKNSHRQMNFHGERTGKNMVVTLRARRQRQFHKQRTMRLQVQRYCRAVHQIYNLTKLK